MSSNLVEAQSEDQASSLVSSSSQLIVLFFWADWNASCKQLTEVVSSLASEHRDVLFLNVEAEKLAKFTMQFQISSVPAFVFVRGGNVLGNVLGFNVPSLVSKVKQLAKDSNAPSSSAFSSSSSSSSASSSTLSPEEALVLRLKQLLKAAPVMLFMKGTPEEPKCGFSSTICKLLKEQNVLFNSFDILQDNDVREGLKKLSNWPTYPQLYANGTLLGGLDVVKEMIAEEAFWENLPEEANALKNTKVDLNTKLKNLITQAKVVLFMKGNAQEPRCGFSSKAVALLKTAAGDENFKFATFDILSDEEVREGLKKYSNWPTYPQLYVKGELVGGLDVMNELHSGGELKDMLLE